LQRTFSGVTVNNNSNSGACEKVDLEMRHIRGKLNEHFAEVKTEMSNDCLHSVCIRPARFWLWLPASSLADSHYILLLMSLSSIFFSSSNLGGLWADHHQTLPHVRWWL